MRKEEKKKTTKLAEKKTTFLSWPLFSLACLCRLCSRWPLHLGRVSGPSCSHLPGCHQRYSIPDWRYYYPQVH